VLVIQVLHVGVRGGAAMSSWLALCSAGSRRREWGIELRRLSAGAEVNAEVAQELVEKEGTKWHMHILNILACRGPQVNRQLFYVTLAARARSISRRGTDMFSSWRSALGDTSYVREVEQELAYIRHRLG
jgi:hypothetical protein